jgi:mRNA-degrading endonuclease RelE of RelBE toxin-antitoxin system
MKTRRVTISKQAFRQMRSIPLDRRLQIMAVIDDLAQWPDTPNCKSLKGRNDYRMRVGRYRVIFTVEPDRVIVQEVRKRDERAY